MCAVFFNLHLPRFYVSSLHRVCSMSAKLTYSKLCRGTQYFLTLYSIWFGPTEFTTRWKRPGKPGLANSVMQIQSWMCFFIVSLPKSRLHMAFGLLSVSKIKRVLIYNRLPTVSPCFDFLSDEDNNIEFQWTRKYKFLPVGTDCKLKKLLIISQTKNFSLCFPWLTKG